MKQTQKVLWTKGVLLTPQHLQTQDRFLEDLIEFQLSAVAFCPWGFRRLEIDREALNGGLLSISAASGVFPDGLPFEIPQSDPPPAPKPIEDYWQPDAESLDIHLAIPEHQPGGYNVASNDRDRHTRYVAEVIMRRDENTGLTEKPLQVARKNFRLLAEGESLEGASTLRVARIRRTTAGIFELDPQFVPPLIDISANEYVLSIARRLVELLSARSSALGGMRRQRNQSLAEFGVSDVANFWLLYTVNTHLPRFRHIYETRRGHPSQLFDAMLALAGALTTFSTMHPRELPDYEHADLSGAITRLDEMLRRLLETVVPVNHISLTLRRTAPLIYATAIDQDRYFTAPQFYLAIAADIPQDELVRKVPQLLKLSSADQIDRLIKSALPGVRLAHVPTPPSALPIKLNYQYFVLDRGGADWDAIKLARNVAAYVPADFPEPQLELLAILPSERR